MPPDAILSGLMLLLSLFLSHCAIEVPGTAWVELLKFLAQTG